MQRTHPPMQPIRQPLTTIVGVLAIIFGSIGLVIVTVHVGRMIAILNSGSSGQWALNFLRNSS
jgi:hypothetical protein